MRKITSLLTLLLLMVSGVNVWGQLPESLELTTDKNNPKCYYIKSKRTNNGSAIFLRYNGDNAKPFRVANAEVAGVDGLWYFMAGTDANNTVKIFNYNGKALTHNQVFSENGDNWYIKDNQFQSGAYTISKNAEVGSGSNCIDANNYDGNIGWWNSTESDNEGTAWVIEKAEAPNFQTMIQELKAKVNKAELINKNVNDTYVGFLSDQKKNELAQAITEAEGKSTRADFEKFEKAVMEILSPKFEEGAYYEIELQNPGVDKKYPSTQNMHSNTNGVFGTEHNNDRVVRRVTPNDPLLPRLWKFEKQTNGNYKVRNANTECVWSSYVAEGIDMPIDKAAGGTYKIQFIPCNAAGNNGDVDAFNTKFTISIDGHMMNAYQGNDNTVIRDYVGNHIGDKGSWWSFKKVTEIPVTIGATGWASICLPFAVTLPEGVNAYIAESAQGDVITLKEVSGVIPANTGMLLTATSGSYNLNISKETATANVEGNLFKGANTKRLGFADGETFGMGANGNTAVFKKNNLKNGENGYVPANKAYILTSDLGAAAQGASLLSIEFGGATTGIEGVQAEDNKEVIYFDLNGRRVINPAHGVFVTNTGKKVFIR